MPIRPYQHGFGRGDCSQHRQHPSARVLSVDHLDSIRPRRDVEMRAEVEKYWSCTVEQGKHSRRTLRSGDLEIGHSSPDERVDLTRVACSPGVTWTPQVILHIQSGHPANQMPARLVQHKQLRNDFA
jgi:hypothetical protein